MFKAVDINGNEVSIDKSDDNVQYYCPICKSKLKQRAKKSENIAAHFAHISKSNCDTFTHDMSEWHKNWQSIFPLKNREVSLPFDNPCHRADVLAYGYVIEFQHSPISSEEFNVRNNFYTSIGKKVIWIFDLSEKYDNGLITMIKPQYIHDGKYTDSFGNVKNKWIVNEYRMETTFHAMGASPEIVYGCGIDYKYGRNSKDSASKIHEWKWSRPFKTLNNYNPLVNKDITVFFEFNPNNLNKVIWCDEEINEYIAGNIAYELHDMGEEYFEPSTSRYLEYRERFLIKSDYKSFSAENISIKQFLLQLKERAF
ncbi:MAG: hypothetical protein MSH15_11270 [Oscillospiraceae bacterium]|nr:hypothetical protein [Oscillospiraceae bacterium]